MYTLNTAFYHIKNSLSIQYSVQEASAIAHEVLTHISQLSKIDRLLEKDKALSSTEENELEYMLDELMQGKPMQYVIGESYFLNHSFLVNEQVLIPRPETEELVIWILNDWAKSKGAISVLDIGTGSGCIPISLKSEWADAEIQACDISQGALSLAQTNATRLNQTVLFFQQDILDPSLWPALADYDVLVSNPPYIPENEYKDMDLNVKGYEPHLALFVPDNDALRFYRAIAKLGRSKLKPNGAIYCEMHQDLSEATKAVFEEEGYTQIELRKDMHDNWRMLKAQF